MRTVSRLATKFLPLVASCHDLLNFHVVKWLFARCTAGTAGRPVSNQGVAIVTATRLGLMVEFSYSGAKFTYKPLTRE